jgi:multiple antibiotic resistance protein
MSVEIDLTKAIIALFIVVDPLGDIPIFAALTDNLTKIQKRKAFNTASIIGLVLLLVFSLLGQQIFQIFGISLYGFEVAGGILLFLIAIRILLSDNTHKNAGSNESPETVGAVPIATPLLVGPGAITATILNLQLYGVIVAVVAAVVVVLITWLILQTTGSIYRMLGKTGSLVIARVMALLIAAIAMQYILSGITDYIIPVFK